MFNILKGRAHLCASATLGPSRLIIGQTRTSVWPTNFQEPVTSTDDLAQLQAHDEEKFKQLVYNPIKPLHHFKNNSLFYDPFFFFFEAGIVQKGRRNLARDLVQETLFHIKRIQMKKFYSLSKDEQERSQIELNPLLVFKKAFENCKPVLATKTIKRGGAKYQVPHPVSDLQGVNMTIKWLRDTIRERPKPRKIYFPEALAKELINAYHEEGKVIKIKNDMHKLCETNKAYVHYRWS